MKTRTSHSQGQLTPLHLALLFLLLLLFLAACQPEILTPPRLATITADAVLSAQETTEPLYLPAPTATPRAAESSGSAQLDPTDPDFVLPTPSGAGRLRVTASLVNVRQGPGVSHPVVARVERGNELTVLERRGRWSKIQIDPERVGWLRDDNFVDIP